MGTRRVGLFAAAGVAGAVMALAGCGGTSGGRAARCGEIQPCGGSLVGTWTIQASCENIAAFIGTANCPGATLDESMLVTSGSVAFNTDMTFAITTEVSGSRRFKAPFECLEGALSCTDYARLIVPGPPIATSVCEPTGAGICDCATVYDAIAVSANGGTYSTAGNVLTWAPPGGVPSDTSYCVLGDTLHLIDIDATTSIVATR